MAQQGRVRRSSFEPNPAAMQFFSQDVYSNSNSGSYKQQDPLSLLLGQDMAAAAAAGMHHGNMNGLMQMNGLPPMSAGGIAEQQHYAEPLCMPSGTNGFDSLTLDAEEPGPLPCLPRPGRMPGGYGNSAALLMQQQQQLQQLQRCGYPSSGASGPGGNRGLRPRRHSVTIGMLNEHQQQQALLAAAGGQLPQGWLAGAAGLPGSSSAVPGSGQPPRMPMLPQQSSPNKQLQELQLQAAAAQLAGMGKAGLGQAFGQAGGGAPGMLHGQQLAGGAAGLGGPAGSGNSLLRMDLPPAYALNGPRMPGNNNNSRRHSWAPMGAEGSMAYARSWLLQQQQASGSLTAQLGDAGALFINQQQQDQLGMGRMGPPLLRTPRNGLDSNAAAAAFGAAGQGMLGHDPGPPELQLGGFGGGLPGQGGLQMSVGQPSPVMPLYGSADALAKEQLAQHLQQQLQLQELASRFSGAQQGLDPYAEPFVSQGQLLGQHAAAGLVSMDAYATALQQELQQQQQQQSALALHLCEDVGLSPAAAAAAASMYTPLQINGVSVDTQLLVSPYADNWDVLGQGSGSLSGSAVSSGSGVSALAGMGIPGVTAAAAGPLGQLGMAGKPGKGHAAPMQINSSSNSSSANSSGSGGTRGSHVMACTPSSVASISSAASKAGAGAAPAAAAAAAATMLASLPPLSKVCSEAPWNLKKAADEDAKVMSAQQVQVQKLASVLEHSRTLQEVHAAEDAVAEASAACAAAAAAGCGGSSGAADAAVASASADAAAAALFSYRLPDSGDDTWGGSSGDAAAAAVAAAAAAVVPGGSCISQEPSNKLFVGNIGWWVTEEDLLHWFSRFGSVVNVKIMYNSRKMHKPKDKWRSREYGFIDYASAAEAAKAIAWMDGVELPDLMKDTAGIIVQYAKPTGSGEQGQAGAAAAGS